MTPAAVNDSKTVDEDSATTTIDVLANDTDPDGGAKAIASATQPSNGTVVVAADGLSLSYRPGADYCNDPDPAPADTFTYTVNGGSSASVAVTVTCADDSPVAVDDTRALAEDSAVTTLDVLANDTDPDGGPKTIISATQPSNGTVVVAGDGLSLSYTPDPGYCNDPGTAPTDEFRYTVSGGDRAFVAITVSCVDDLPVAVNDAKTLDEDSPTSTLDVLANDTDPDGGTKTIASATQPSNGTVVVAADGLSLSYRPGAGYCNDPDPAPADTFTYTVNGGSSASVAVTVTCADDSPVAVDDTRTLAEDSPATTLDVLANDTDLDGGAKTIASATQPSNGTVVVAGDGLSLSYTPDPGYCNDPGTAPTDEFRYTLNGGDSAMVAVTVRCSGNAVPAAPRANVIRGTAGNDTINGTPGADVIICGAGDDIVNGGAGNDLIDCGAGNDRVDGGTGSDTVIGRGGHDRLLGSPGNDVLIGSLGQRHPERWLRQGPPAG